MRIALVWLHLLALGVGLGAIWARARALRGTMQDQGDAAAFGRVVTAGSWWGVALIGWVVTGVWSMLTAPSSSGYAGDRAFLLKLAFVVGIVALEVWPMMTLARWRRNAALRTPGDAGRLEVISYVQCALVIAVVLAASSAASSATSSAVRGGAPASPGSGTAQPPADSSSAAARPAGDDTSSVERTTLAPGPTIEPTGVETVTEADLALLTREVAMPLDGVDALALRGSYHELRGGGTREHRALDIMAPRGTPVRSAAAGRVLKLFTSVAGGLMVYAADSSERFILMYAHLDGYAPGLREGAGLVRGQVIGRVGSTGNASPSAPHLHLAIARSADVSRWSKGAPIDPLPVLQAAARQRP